MNNRDELPDANAVSGQEAPFADIRNFRSSVAWKVVATLLTVLALAVVLSMLANAWPRLLEQRSAIDLRFLATGFVLSIVAAFLTFLPFASIVRAGMARGMSLRELGHLYFTAQLLKHLPGRIWGIGYQWAATGRIHSVGAWLSANMLHMALATFFAIASASIALASEAGWKICALSTAVSVLLYLAIWPGISLVCSIAKRFECSRRLRDTLLGYVDVPGRSRFHIFLLFASSWTIYYAGWYLYGLGYPSVGGIGGLRICAFYLLAWFVGYVSLITPSGLGVRELVFAWLAKDFPPDAIAFMAILGRTSLLGVDVILGLLFASYAPAENRTT